MREQQLPTMPGHRVGRRPTHPGLVCELQEPLVYDVVRPIWEVGLYVLPVTMRAIRLAIHGDQSTATCMHSSPDVDPRPLCDAQRCSGTRRQSRPVRALEEPGRLFRNEAGPRSVDLPVTLLMLPLREEPSWHHHAATFCQMNQAPYVNDRCSCSVRKRSVADSLNLLDF